MYSLAKIQEDNARILHNKFNTKVRLSERSLSNESLSAQRHFSKIPKEIIIENLNSYSSKDSFKEGSEQYGYLETMNDELLKKNS